MKLDSKLDTFPKLLLNRKNLSPNRPAMREKDFGIWQTWTWEQVANEVRSVACGLAAAGFRRGDKLAIVGDNRPRLYWGIAAAQCLGGIPVPLYQDSVAEEMEYVINHADVRFALVEDQEQVDKLLEIAERCPKLEQIYYDDPRGLKHYTPQNLHEYKNLIAEGDAFSTKNPEFFENELQKGSSRDISVILYTSGTTGFPKGVILTYRNILTTVLNSIEFDKLTEKEECLAYLPMAWVGDHIFSYAQSYVSGFCVSCPESGATVMHDMQEIGPTYFFSPPRIFENILTTVLVRMEDATWIKRKMFDYFMGVARRCGIRILEKESVGLVDRILYLIGNFLVYGPLKNTMGFSRMRLAYTAGEAIGPEIFEFFRSLGINVKQLYGQTEASVYITMQADNDVKPDTCGPPFPDVDVKISDTGEIMYKSPGVFHSYYKNPEATLSTRTGDGWVFTGDAGYFDNDGHLKIIDRVKDVGKLNDGTLFAPKFLENKLKFFPQIREVVTFGDQKDYVSAFINIDLDAVSNWAERHSVSYASYQELAGNEQVYEMIRKCIEKTNQDLSSDSEISGSQIKKFLILHKELDADDGELTRTRKVRRRIISERFSSLIDALYSDSNRGHIENVVTFEDGRKGTMSADLEIQDVQIFDHMKMAS